MLVDFEIWVLPNNLRVGVQKASIFLRHFDFNVLCLNIQQNIEDLIEDLALGASYEGFIKRLKEMNLLYEPISSWKYWFEPILLALRGIKIKKPELKIICYKSPMYERILIEFAEKIAILTLKTILTERIDVSEWRNLIHKVIFSSRYLNHEAKHIIEALNKINGNIRALCISDFSARNLMKILREHGVKSRLRYIFSPYYFTPIEVLLREAARAFIKGIELNNGRITELVSLHTKFIREYVLLSANYDEAYFKWIRNRSLHKGF